MNELKLNLPQFDNINPDDIKPKLEALLAQNKQEISILLKQNGSFSWDNLIHPLENINDHLNQYWSVIQHLHSVCNTPKLREAYNACLPLLSDYSTELSHNVELFHAIQSIAVGPEYQKLDYAQQRSIDNDIRDFKLSGVALDHEKKEIFAKLSKNLSQLQTKFEENVLDATQGWYKLVENQDELSGLPERVVEAAKMAAEKLKLNGWVFNLEAPSYGPVLRDADNAALREEMYRAYVTRASELGPCAKRWDNTEVMQDILKDELELAKLLGFNNYAEKSLATKMANSPEEVLNFLNQLLEASTLKAAVEYKELQEFALKEWGVKELQAWDITYYTEKLRVHHYDISHEELRAYFPQPKVLNGLFEVVHRLFNITIKEIPEANKWHPDVRCYAVYDEHNELRAAFYMDLYARENKRGGAWMDDCRIRRNLDDGSIQIPIAFITCNFNAPVGDEPALFYHDDVVTLFHEFGHALQHMLTTIKYSHVSGINGVPWDAVEFSSQFLENWAWQKQGLDLIAQHYKTGVALPEHLFERMIKAKNFQAALHMTRQIKFALFDFRLFLEFDPLKPHQIQQILDEVRQLIDVIPTPDFNRFQNHFSHIFAGGYSAGYYSYLWAEVLACDAFSLFEEKGIFDTETSQAFLHCILETGGSEDPAVLFKRFRGRDAHIEALLKQTGIY